MEFLIFILGLAGIALLADIHEKYHERQMAKERQMVGPKNWREVVYA